MWDNHRLLDRDRERAVRAGRACCIAYAVGVAIVRLPIFPLREARGRAA